MSYWLFKNVIQEDNARAPEWSLQSTLNWMKVLSYEINREHGDTPDSQFDSCRKIFTSRSKVKGVTIPTAEIFEPLFHSLTFCVALITINRSTDKQPWIYPSVVVSWYYSCYNAFRSMLCANNQRIADTHASVIKCLNSGLRKSLPHPLNMIAVRASGEIYHSRLPDYPDSVSFDLVKAFNGTPEAARGMILQYLSGTAQYEVDKTKEAILKDKKFKFTNFRTKEAREQRDRQLQNEINFMHCAFRYRGKANYRDAIFMTYGQRDLSTETTFIDDLATTARFAFITALAYAEYQVGKKKVRSFLDDLRTNFRGITNATKEEVFWMDLSV